MDLFLSSFFAFFLYFFRSFFHAFFPSFFLSLCCYCLFSFLYFLFTYLSLPSSPPSSCRSLSALGIAPDIITQSLQELRPAGTIRKTTSATSTITRSTSGSGAATAGFGPSATSVSHTSQLPQTPQQVGGNNQIVQTSVPKPPVQTTYADSGLFSNALAGTQATAAQEINVNVNLNGSATAQAGSEDVEETSVKQMSKSMQSLDVSEASDDEEDEESEEESDEESEAESSMASSGMEQVDFAQRKKAHLHQQAVKIPQPVAPAAPLQLATANGNFFGQLMEDVRVTENVNINKTETRNVNVTENVNVNMNHNVASNGLKTFFDSGQHITGSKGDVQVTSAQKASADMLARPVAVKPPAYDTLGQQPGPTSDVGAGGSIPKVSGRAGEIYGNLADWQNRTLQRPQQPPQGRNRYASAGDPLLDERRPFDRTRPKSAERELDPEPGVFQRTQSMRSLKMWYEHQRTTGRSRGGTPEPDRISPYGVHRPQQPLIMDLDKNDRLYINPSTATLVRSKSRQGHQTLTKSSGALVPVKQAPRPATAMGNSYALVSRDQVMLQKNYQLQMYLRQQYLAQQQQQQQQQQALLMQQQMQQQQAMFLQQQIQREEELLRKKKEKEKKEKEKRARQLREQEMIEEQLKRSTTIINESMVVNQHDPKVKRVFVRRAKKEPKPPSPPPPPKECKEFSCQTITDTGIQTEKPESPPPPPPTFSETLIVQSQTPSPAPIRFVETVTISPPTPEPEEESEEEWEVLVSSDQNSWNMVAKETLPARVVRAASLSNLEFFIRDELSAETQKVLDEAEEVRFSEEVIQTILTKTVEDTTTTNTSKTISMTSEGQSMGAAGDFIIQDVEEDEAVVLPAITAGPYTVMNRGGDALDDTAHARTTTVTKISTEPYQDTQVVTQETDGGHGKLMETSFHQGHATIVDDRVAYNYGTSNEANAEFQRQLQQMQAEFGQAGDVVSDSGMSYNTPSGSKVSVEQKVSTMKTGVQLTLGDGSTKTLGHQQLTQQEQQKPVISITDMETDQILPPQQESFTNAYTEPELQVTTGELGEIDVSLGDYRIAAIKRRVSTAPDQLLQSSPRLTPDRDPAAKSQPKGILKKRPSSSTSDASGSVAHQFTEQFLGTVQQVQQEGKVVSISPPASPWGSNKSLEVTSAMESTLPEPVRKTSTSVSQVEADAVLPGLFQPPAANNSSTIVVQANSPSPQRKIENATAESSSVDISLESPATKHFSTHLHKTISSSSPTLMVEVDPAAGKKATTILTTTLDFSQENDSASQAIVDKTATLSQKTIEDQSSVSQSAQGSSVSATTTTLNTDLSSSLSQLSQGIEEKEVNAELVEIMNQVKQTQLRSGSKSEASLVGAILPPLEHDIERVREKFVTTVSQRRDTSDNAGALGRKLIALKRETEAKETTLTYFNRRLKEEEDVLHVIQQTDGGGVPYIEGRRKTQETNVGQLREKVAGLEQSISEGKTKIEALELEWKQMRPEGETDLLASLSRSTSTSRAELGGGVSTENLASSANGGVAGGLPASNGAVATSASVTIDTMESKAVAVEKEAMRSVLSTISSQFTARNQDFDRLRREEEEIKALLASRMRGIDLEIDQIEAEQQRMEIEQVLDDLETEDGLVTANGTAVPEVESNS